jgi:4-amino-4-deoxy-L-arabinose transferase-like glycosyltransferase
MPRVRLRATDADLVGVTLAIKLVLLVAGVLALYAASGAVPDPFEPWHRWDAPHYTDLAVFGYRAEDPGTLIPPAGYRQTYPGDLDLYVVFFPLYPWLVAGVNTVIGAPVVAAFVVTTVASVFVAPLLHRLVAADLGERIGRRSALLLLVFPTAYFLHIGYTESLFLALAFGSMWLGRTDRWIGAGIVGGLAALTRANGLVLVPALAVEAYLQWRVHRRLDPRWGIALLLVVVGFAVYLLLNLAVYRDAFAFAEIQREHWFKDLSPPWEGLVGLRRWIFEDNADLALMYGWMELVFVVLGLAVTVAAALRLRASWAVWTGGNWLLIVSTGFVASAPRYSLALFAFPVFGAIILDRWPRIGWLLAAASTLAMGYFAWRFATGRWAF